MDYSKFSNETLKKLYNNESLDPKSLSDDELKELYNAAPSVPTDDPSKTESFLRGAAQGLTLGFADEISGAVESAFTDKTYQEARDESRNNFDTAKDANPWSYGIGEVGTGVATAFIPGLNVAKGATMGSRALKAASLAGAYGLGSSTADITKGEYGDAIKDTATAAAIGGVMQPVGEGVSKAVSSAIKNLSPEKLAVKALGPTYGDLKSLNRQGPESINKFGRFLLDETDQVTGKPIVAFGDKVEDIAEKAVNYQSKISGEIGEVVSNVDDLVQKLSNNHKIDPIGVDLHAVADQIENNIIPQIGEDKPLFGAVRSRLEQEVEALRKLPRFMSFQDAQARKIGYYDKLVNWDKDQPVFQELAKNVRGIFNKQIEQSMNNVDWIINHSPQGTDLTTNTEVFKYLKEMFGKAIKAEDIATSRMLKEEASNALANPFKNWMTYGGIGGGLLTGNPVTGAALGFGAQAVKDRGYSSAAVALDRIKSLIESNQAQSLGKYAKPLSDAFQKGNKALATTIFLLGQQDPQFRQQVLQNENK